MLSQFDSNLVRHFFTVKDFTDIARRAVITVFVLGIFSVFSSGILAQGNVTGGFKGTVRIKGTGDPVPAATVVIKNLQFGTEYRTITESDGSFSRGSLPTGDYKITVSKNGFNIAEKAMQPLFAMDTYKAIPDPFELEPIVPVTVPPVTVNPGATPAPVVTPPTPTVTPDPGSDRAEGEAISLSTRRVGIFGQEAVVGLPLGSTTLTRTFDELAFLVPGVNAPPQAIGNSVGPGVGGGVGTSGQFSVNGLRSRTNNFTVDGSDNNDEDIGVRRQGFFTLVPQPPESIQEFQITTLLAPAEFGRNLGAQVNAISKSGGNRFHGSVFGFANGERLNARNAFDSAGGNFSTEVRGIRPSDGASIPVLVDDAPLRVPNDAGDKDDFSLFQGGIAIGGRIVRDKLFFFTSVEGQELGGTRERNFAVPTVAQRGLFNSGTTGLQQCQPGPGGSVVNGVCRTAGGVPVNFSSGFPTTLGGDAALSLFPFANNPNGIYGANTYTQALSTDASGRIFSAKVDYAFSKFGQPQTLTARYNYTDDERDLTDVGGALFSAIRPQVRTDNFSTYLNGGISNRFSNEFRFSFGRTDLDFEELPDTTGFLMPVSNRITNPRDRRFLLNARHRVNNTLPTGCTSMGCFAPGIVFYDTFGTTENSDLGPIGQLIVAGFSPVGVDVFNFPQRRTNDTFQFAETLRWQLGSHSVSFGADIRAIKLASDLPRNSRPLVTFYGGVNTAGGSNFGPTASALTLAAGGAATGFFQSLVLPGANSEIELNYSQLNFFVQDEWKIRRNVNLTLGLRYEYNTTPKEADRKIEDTFDTPASEFPIAVPGVNFFQGFQDIIAGRTNIYDADKNNFAPRLGVAWAVTPNTVVRGGYGLYYDQIIGSVVSQSRNVYPTFTTINTGGGELVCTQLQFTLLNPITGSYSPTSCGSDNRFPLVQPGTLNTLNPAFRNRRELLTALLFEFPLGEVGTTLGTTLPLRTLPTPLAHQYTVGIERKVGDTFLSAAYVGTTGRNLLRFTTPNLGNNFVAAINGITLSQDVQGAEPVITGITFNPFGPGSTDLTRPDPNIGPVEQFETTGRSQYHSLQIGVRGNIRRNLQYGANYVYGHVRDDVSDVFDLAGSSALPQNSLTFAGEYADANFDVRHRFTYNFLYGLPRLNGQSDVVRHIFGGWELAGTGRYSSGQPFTVNSIFDVNFDGNLTDRLDNFQFITETGDRAAPLSLSCDPGNCSAMLADFGEDGVIPRNSFRAGSVLELDLAVSRRFRISEEQNIQFRVDFFNFINRANFGIPVRFLGFPGFGRANDTVTPGRRIQFALKYNF